MTDVFITELLMISIRTIALLVGPLLLTIIVVAILSNVLQTVTQIKDPSLAFVPKVVAATLVIVLAAPWFLQLIESYGRGMLSLISRGPM
jgi:flagellar biosynthetic protein FliQ